MCDEYVLSKSDLAIVEAYKKGYRVTDDGRLINKKGRELATTVPNKGRYPQFGVAYQKYKVKSVRVHRFAAYCFYGEELFTKGIEVRHLNSDVNDFSRDNIALGTHFENEMDKPPESRIRDMEPALSATRGLPRRHLRRLSDEQARELKISLKNNECLSDLSRKYGITLQSILQIRRGQSYADIEI